MSPRHLALVLPWALSCGGANLGTPWLVNAPRVVAVIAEPAEAHPGDSLSLRALVGGFAAAPTVQWTACARPEETGTSLPISSYGQFVIDRGCASAGAVRVDPVGSGDRVTWTVPEDTLRDRAVLRAVYGALPDEELSRLASTVGVALVVSVRASDGARTVEALKRVVVVPAERPRNRNPPAPRFTFGDVRVTVTADDRCEGATPLTVAPGAGVRLTPDEDESWREEYTLVGPDGALQTRREEAFYSVATTAGAWDLGRARQPDRSPLWTAPAAEGTVTHWLVVRDGRGGTSACRYEVRVAR